MQVDVKNFAKSRLFSLVPPHTSLRVIAHKEVLRQAYQNKYPSVLL